MHFKCCYMWLVVQWIFSFQECTLTLSYGKEIDGWIGNVEHECQMICALTPNGLAVVRYPGTHVEHISPTIPKLL